MPSNSPSQTPYPQPHKVTDTHPYSHGLKVYLGSTLVYIFEKHKLLEAKTCQRVPKVGAGHAEGGQGGVQGKRRVFEGTPNGSQEGAKGDQGDKGTPREAKGEPHHATSCSFWPVVLSTSEDKWLALANSLAPFGDHRLATSKVFKYCPFLGSVDDVDLKVSNGDFNFEHNLEYGRGRRGATHISGTAKLCARLVELGAPCAQAATLTDS